MKLFTQCYLNELYFNAIKEADDPVIQIDGDDLSPLKTFPIARVKERNRNMWDY